MTVSYWRRSGGSKTSRSCDVAVIGAGICGISAALHLQRRGLKACVLERHALASGASSRNAGFLMRGAADNYEVARREWGVDRARLVWRMTEENIAGLRAEGIEKVGTYRAIPSALLAMEAIEEGELRRSVGLLHADGFDADWLEQGDRAWSDAIGAHAKQRGIAGALVNPGDASCNSWDLLRFLASQLNDSVLEGQEVFGIEERDGRVAVRASDIEVIAERALLCTNAYAPLLVPVLGGVVKPKRGQMLAIDRPASRLDCSYYANRGFEYFRQASDGTIVVGGCRRAFADMEVGYDDVTTANVQDSLEVFASGILGIARADLRVVARWSGVMGFTPDGLPIVGAVPGPWRRGRVWFCGGCTGHGMSLFHRTARLAVEAMLDGIDNPFDIARFERAGDVIDGGAPEEAG
jgi:glycine/D-amino acid oxidase-like deaminating enzyme